MKKQGEKHDIENLQHEELVINLKEEIENQNAELKKQANTSEVDILEANLKYTNDQLAEKDELIANLRQTFHIVGRKDSFWTFTATYICIGIYAKYRAMISYVGK